MWDLAADSECTPAPHLQIDVEPGGRRCTVRLDGELDLTSVDQLRSVLSPLCEGRHRLVVVDVGELRFLGLVGLQVLAQAEQTMRAAGCRLVLADPDAITVRVLGITGLDQFLHVVPAAAQPSMITERGHRRPYLAPPDHSRRSWSPPSTPCTDISVPALFSAHGRPWPLVRDELAQVDGVTDQPGANGVPVALHGGNGLPLAVVVYGSAPHGRVQLIGRLDERTVPILRETIASVRAEGFSVLTVDPSTLATLSHSDADALRRLREELDTA